MADIFDPENKTELDPNKDYHSELVGDGKKFKDDAALARGKAESDLFIQRLLKEQDEMRTELTKRINMEDVLKEIKELKPKPIDQEESPPPPENKGLTPEELESLLDRKLAERTSQTVFQQNEKLASEELIKRFGSEEIASSEIKRKAKELDINLETLKQLAQKTPKAFLQLFTETQKAPSAPKSSVNTTSFSGPTGPRTKTAWDKIRKENPTAYFSKEAMIERHKDAMRQGEAFFDT